MHLPRDGHFRNKSRMELGHFLRSDLRNLSVGKEKWTSQILYLSPLRGIRRHQVVQMLRQEANFRAIQQFAFERRWNTSQRKKSFYLKATARIWPWLSYMCHKRSTAEGVERKRLWRFQLKQHAVAVSKMYQFVDHARNDGSEGRGEISAHRRSRSAPNRCRTPVPCCKKRRRESAVVH